MVEERRNGLVDLEDKLDTHIQRFETFEEDLLTVIAGPIDPLTKQRNGGMRGQLGQQGLDVAELRYQADNGGVNARVKLTVPQMVALALVAIPGLLALMQTLIEKQ